MPAISVTTTPKLVTVSAATAQDSLQTLASKYQFQQNIVILQNDSDTDMFVGIKDPNVSQTSDAAHAGLRLQAGQTMSLGSESGIIDLSRSPIYVVCTEQDKLLRFQVI